MPEDDKTSRRVHPLISCAAYLMWALVLVRCSSTKTQEFPGGSSHASDAPPAVAAWTVVYGVLQHPRCLNCHPANDAPLQGDQSVRHAQNVQRGEDGQGLFAMHCDACHRTENLPGAHLPPGAPNWHLPKKSMPLVFEGMSSRDLCLQLRDQARNGGKTPEELYEHVAHDPLVGWGWNPGDGRTPVPTPREKVAQAMRAWIDGGCGCPEP